MIEIKNVSKWYGSFQVLTDCTTARLQGRGGRGVRALGLRQMHAHQDRQRARAVPERRHHRRRRLGRRAKDTNLSKLRSRIGMVFQNFELFPHLSVTENLTLGQIKVLGRPQDEADRARAQAARPRRPDRAQGQVPGPALRRPAAARRHRARAVDGPDRDAVRRADLRARPRDDQRGARRDGRARQGRHDHDGGDPRDGLRHARSRTA